MLANVTTWGGTIEERMPVTPNSATLASHITLLVNVQLKEMPELLDSEAPGAS